MDELVPNPDGCRAFEPNQFKKEKCKNCGRPWQEHQGVISEALVNSYCGARRKATEDKLQKEADAQAKLKAKAVAKKKAQQAVEDEWLFDSKDGDKGAAANAESDDDDMGFRMFSAQDLAHAPIESRVASNSDAFKPLKVKNLIDFGECDVAEELGLSTPSMPPAEVEPAAKPPLNTTSSVPSASSSSSAAPPALATTTPTSPEEQGGVMADLLAEIEHMKHMLQNANEEKNIQVAIIKDEVVEKETVIEDMKSQRTADQAEIAKLREQLAGAGAPQQQATEADALRQQLEERNAEIERLKAAALVPQPPPAPSDLAQEEELSRLRLEVEELRQSKATESAAPTLSAALSSRLAEAYSLCITTCRTLEEDASIALPPTLGEEVTEDALRHLCEAAHAVQAAASRSSTERRQLLQKLSDAEVAAKSVVSSASLPVSKPPSTVTEALQEAPSPAEALPQEVVHQQVVHRQAALALREVRLNAERQLAWISKRIKTSYQDGRGSAISCP